MQNIPPVQLTEKVNMATGDIKTIMRTTQAEIKRILAEFGDNTRTTVTIDGDQIKKSDPGVLLAIQNKLDQLSSTSTSMLSIFNQLYSLERSLGQQ